jgi:acyl carrier protein phosphodiesterase
MVRPSSRRTSLRRLLAGGDRRSIVGADRVLSILRAQPERIRDVAMLADDEDWLVSMRALDVLEKIAHHQADWIRPDRTARHDCPG